MSETALKAHLLRKLLDISNLHSEWLEPATL